MVYRSSWGRHRIRGWVFFLNSRTARALRGSVHLFRKHARKAAATENALHSREYRGPHLGKLLGDVTLFLPVIEFLDASEGAYGPRQSVSLVGTASKPLVPESPDHLYVAEIHMVARPFRDVLGSFQ